MISTEAIEAIEVCVKKILVAAAIVGGLWFICFVPVIRETTREYTITQPGLYEQVVKGKRASFVVSGEKIEEITLLEHFMRMPKK